MNMSSLYDLPPLLALEVLPYRNYGSYHCRCDMTKGVFFFLLSHFGRKMAGATKNFDYFNLKQSMFCVLI